MVLLPKIYYLLGVFIVELYCNEILVTFDLYIGHYEILFYTFISHTTNKFLFDVCFISRFINHFKKLFKSLFELQFVYNKIYNY